MRRTYLILLLCAAMSVLTSCVGKQKSDKGGSVQVYCDETFQNIMEQEVDVYEYIYPDNHVLVRYGSEAEAIDSLKSLDYPVIVIPRELTAAETQAIKNKNRHPRSLRIAVDAVALIINPENPAEDLSTTEVADILSGKTTSWSQLSPHYPDRPIEVLFDKSGSSMVKYMADSLLNGAKLAENSHAQGSVEAVIKGVQEHKNAIGVVGVSWLTSNLKAVATVDSIAADVKNDKSVPDMGEIDARMGNSGVKVLGIRSVDNPKPFKPYQKYIYSGEYPFTRSMYMITISPGGSQGGLFYAFVTGKDGQKLIMKTGVLPARMQVQVVELVP